MARALRIGSAVAAGILLGVVAAVVAVYLLNETRFGAERVRAFLVSRVEERIQGELRIGAVRPGRLLGGAVIEDFAVEAPGGRPFLRADSVRVRYDLLDLLAGRWVFRDVVLYSPVVVIERLPGDTAWNYQHTFADPTPEEDGGGPAPYILIENARVVGGTIVIRWPWEPQPGEAVEPEDTVRLILERAPRVGDHGTGLVRVVRFEDVNAELPRVLWSSPIEEGRLFEVASLETRGFMYEEPFELRHFRGTVTQRDSVISIDARDLRLPGSRATGAGRFIDRAERDVFDLDIQGDRIAFRDLRWLYPNFPEEGGGKARIRIQTLDPRGTLWLVEDAHLRAPGTEVAGTFGIVTGDTLYFTRVDLRASPLNLEVLADVLPGDLPLEGLLVGTVEVEGPISALQTSGDLRLYATAPVRSTSAIRWAGIVNIGEELVFRGMRARIADLDLALLAALGVNTGLAGSISGDIEATGRLDRGITFAGRIEHSVPDHPTSLLEGRGRVLVAGDRRELEATLEARPLALDALAAANPSLRRLRGEARGTFSVSGSLDDLSVQGELETPGGRVDVEGRLDVGGARPAYDVTGRVSAFRLDHVVHGLPETTADAEFRLDGAGSDLATMRAAARIDLERARFDGVPIHRSVVALQFEDGLARVDSLRIRTSAGSLEAEGDFGLVPERSGTIRVALRSDSLGALDRVLLPDSLGAALVEPAPSRIGGRMQLAADVVGSIAGFDATGEARFVEARLHGAGAANAVLRFAATGVRSDSVRIEARADVDSLAYGDRLLTTAALRASYRAGGTGELRAEASAPGDQTFSAAAAFRRVGGGFEVDLHELGFATHGTTWVLDTAATLRLDEQGLAVAGLRLHQPDAEGRIGIEGRLPWKPAGRARDSADVGPASADFRVDLRNVRIADFLGAAGPEPATDGLLGGWVRVGGTARNPVMDARFTLGGFRYQDVRLDSIAADLGYRDRRLTALLSAVDGGRSIFVGSGTIPVDLSFAHVEQRRLDEPLRFSFHADSVPAGLPLSFFDAFRDVRGRMDGTLTFGGTTRNPTLGGEFTLRGASAFWEPMGVRYRDVQGTFRVLNDSVLGVDVGFRSDPGRAAVRGLITFRPLNDPRFDLAIRLDRFRAAERRDVEVTGTGELRLTGQYTRPVVAGSFEVDGGALYLDELWRQYNVVQLGGPLLYEVIDTTRVSVRQILPASAHPFLRNMVVTGTVRVGRDFWLRSETMNVEVSGELDVEMDRSAEDLRLTGTLDVVRGTYLLASGPVVRRFQVREGTVEFVGTPGIDPNLDITAQYPVRTRTDPLLIQARVTGTLLNPRVALSSDADPPIAESDLLSYLIFGRPTYALAASEQTALGAAAGQIGLQAIAPTVWGYAASGLEVFAQNVGIDYLSLTAEGAPQGLAGSSGLADLFAGTQVELGQYLRENLFIAFTRRLAGETTKLPGIRLEWRIAPTWTAELFSEDRFARQPSFSFDQSPTVSRIYGFFLFREWGY